MEHSRLRILLSSLVALVAIQMQAEAQKLPRLVVCISVDQLRSDYLRELVPLMGEGGLRRMLREGRVYDEVDFPFYPINQASATASLFTGVYPSVHGVEGSEVYHRSTGKTAPIFEDNAYLGNYTRDNFSPRALVVPSLGDRLKEASAGRALVYSIAPRAEQAIVSAGEWADGAYWLDERIGAWATSNYYPQMLQGIDRYNRSDLGPNKRLSSGLVWKPQARYKSPSITYADWGRSFSYRYQSKDIKAYRESALMNEEVSTLALKLLEAVPYAEGSSPGLLSLAYTAKTQTGRELDAEDVDTYLRLDTEISRLLRALDERIGLQHCLVTLSGTGYTQYRPYQDAKSQRLGRRVNIARLTALSNMYLTALYGQGTWISSNKNGRLYLNHKLIEAQRLDLSRMQSELGHFLSTAEGVAYAYPAHRLHTAQSALPRELHLGTHPRWQADVYWGILPKWQIEDGAEHNDIQHYSKAIPSPFVIMGQGIEPSSTPLPRIDVRDVVRLICQRLRIRPPND